MVRSSGVPRSRALAGITSIIAARSNSKTFERPTESKNSLGETTTDTSEFHESVWLYAPHENNIGAEAGERSTGDLGGLIVAERDSNGEYPHPVEKNDRIVHGGVEYEVDTVVGAPDDERPDYWQITFIRRH